MGTFGVVALVLVIGLRVALVAALMPRAGALALIAAHALARGVSAATVVSAPSAGRVSGRAMRRSRRVARRRRGHRRGHHRGPYASGSPHPWRSPLPRRSLLQVRWAERALGGVSGDVLGTIEQTGELITLLVAVAFAAHVAGFPLV